MSFTLQSVLDASLVDVHEPSYAWVEKDNGFVRWANEAIQIICEITESYLEEDDIYLVNDQKRYNLPSNFIRMRRVQTGDDATAIYSRQQYVNDRYGKTSVPFTYDIENPGTNQTNLLLTPTPESDDDISSLNILYVAEHDAVEDDADQIDLPLIYRGYIVDYVDMRFKYADEEFAGMERARREWVNELQQGVQRTNRQQNKGAKAVDLGRIRHRNRVERY